MPRFFSGIALLCALPLLPGSALAGGTTYEGSITEASPTADFDGTVYEYSVLGPLTVSVTGTYAFADLRYALGPDSSQSGLDIEVFLYESSFNPVDTESNLVERQDDWGGFDLESGTSYIPVVVPYDPGDAGDFGIAFTGELSDVDAVVSGGNSSIETYDGVFDLKSPTAVFADSPGESLDVRGGPPVNCSYDVLGPFNVDQATEYGWVDGSYQTGVDLLLWLYAGGFNPADTNEGVLDEYDDNGIFTFEAGVDYFLVVRPFGCPTAERGASAGYWSFALADRGVVATTLEIPTASTWGLLALVCGCLLSGLVVLRRM